MVVMGTKKIKTVPNKDFCSVSVSQVLNKSLQGLKC